MNVYGFDGFDEVDEGDMAVLDDEWDSKERNEEDDNDESESENEDAEADSDEPTSKGKGKGRARSPGPKRGMRRRRSEVSDDDHNAEDDDWDMLAPFSSESATRLERAGVPNRHDLNLVVKWSLNMVVLIVNASCCEGCLLGQH